MSQTGFIAFKHNEWQGEVAKSAGSYLNEILSLLTQDTPDHLLKTGSTRRVWVGESSIGPVCIKEYLYPKSRDHWVRLLRGSRALREWTRLKVFDNAGVPIPTPILWSEGIGPMGELRSVVMTRFIQESCTLDVAINQKKRIPQRWRMARSVGEALAAMHSIGARHDDLHAGNILLEAQDEEPRAWIMDLHEVKLKKRLTWNSRLRNLATLYGGLRWNLSPREKQHALKGYLSVLTDWKPPFRSEFEARQSMGRALEMMGRAHFRHRSRDRIKKCTVDGKRFHRIRAGDYDGWLRAEYDTQGLVERLRNPNSWIESQDCRVLKHTPTTTVVRAETGEGQPILFLKRYNRCDWWEKTKNLFRHSRAMKVWRAGYGLEVMGIPTPKVVAMIEKRRGPLLFESFILTEWTEGGVGLDDFWNSKCSPNSEDRLDIVEEIALRNQVAEIFRRLHDLRISHGDLKGRNILLKPDRGGHHDPQFVDLDAIQLHPFRFKRSRINDLSRLLFSVYPNASLFTQIRFFKEYCEGNPILWENRREWWGKIRKRTELKLREKGLI